MQSGIFGKRLVVALLASGAWYTRAAWVVIVLLWLSFVMFLVDISAY